MDFIGLMKNENDSRKTLTENGAVAYATTGKELLDFNFMLSSMRRMEEEQIRHMFSKVYFEDPLTSVKYLFWVGDTREGAGERKVFRTGLLWLADNKPKIMKALIPFVGEYNRFDSLLPLLDTKLRKDVSSYCKEVIEKDIEAMHNNKSVSLLSKWMGTFGASPQSKHYAWVLTEDFGWSPKKYRKTMVTLREYLNIVEQKMTANQWNEIDYEAVPSKANLIYANAFLRHDEERRRAYLNSLQRGEAKINAGVLQPHEIVNKYTLNDGWWGSSVGDYNETLEQLWKNLPNMTMPNGMLCVRDGSGSMTSRISGNTTCLDVATALTIYMAERNNSEWKNKFITFSSRPQIVDISNCETLRDKLELINEYDECSNTDVYKTMKLILNAAVNNRLSQEEIPQNIAILSDMEFDGRVFNFGKTLFEDISDEFEAAGYKLPKIIFWNINDRGERSVPLRSNDYGLVLCSGFSVQIMKMFMSNNLDPYAILLETINAPRYDAVEEAVKNLI